jgi:hypothetical protein
MSIVPASALSAGELLSLGNNLLPAVQRDRTLQPRDFRHPRSARRRRWGWRRRRHTGYAA